ncbi:unnamed protein product [Amaranthus hypochondriacus]
MASFSAIKTSQICILLFFSFAFVLASCFEYEVGGKRGWIKPDGSESETYNEWAEQNRFHIGDTINFKYKKDSVLLVGKDDYMNCNVKNPLLKFDDGNTIYEFDHSGFVYFISGNPGHCELGQKMIIRVMVQSAVHHPTVSAPAPSVEGPIGAPDGGNGLNTDSWAPPAVNSTDMLSVTSCFITLFMGVVMVLYLFME